MLEKIEPRHREEAAKAILDTTGTRWAQKDLYVAEKILAGEADDHPRVQAAAFYEAHPEGTPNGH